MLQVRQRLGDFEIIRLLGKGGMGEVYEAQQLNPPRRVALKVLAPWLAEDEEALQRFWREAAVPAQLDHPGIVRIITTDKSPDGIAYYTMQLVRGVSLAQMIQTASAPPDPSTVARQTVSQALPSQETPSNAGPLPPFLPVPADDAHPAVVREYLADRYGVVVRIGIQAARALAAAHCQGVFHRDIKPSNLMVDHHDHLYVVDFGLTRALTASGMASMAGVVRGTPWYMSPEQARGDAVDGRSDVYSLGVTLYELASVGMGPYTASRQNSEAILAQVKGGQALPLRVFAADVPAALERVVHKAMHFNPRRRYQTAAELAHDLEKLAKQPGWYHTPATRPAVRPGKPLQRVVLVTVAIGIAFAAVFFLAANWPFQAEKDPDLRIVPGNSAGGNSLPKALREHPLGGDSKPLPPERIQRTWKHPIPLFKHDPVEPIWEYRLAGTGTYDAGRQMELFSRPADTCTLIALDADPKRRWFEFSIEIDQVPPQHSYDNRLGVFFGWSARVEDLDRQHRFFVLEVDERPVPLHKHGRVTLGTAYIVPPKGSRAEDSNWFEPLPEGKGVLALTKTQVWHTLTVRALDDKITLTVDDILSTDIDVAQLRRMKPDLANLDARGALGVWAKEGPGFFRKAMLTALPSWKSK